MLKLVMKRFSLFINIFMSIWVLLVFAGCDRSQKVGELEFDYYPEKNIYYSIASSKYYYSLDAGKTWESFTPGSKKQPATLGKKEKVYSTSSEIWKENQSHLKMFEGKRFQLINDVDRNYVATVAEVSDKRPTTIAGSAPKQSAAAPKKKGIKGFFNRIFGKKDKK